MGNVAKLGMKNGLQLNVPSSYDFALIKNWQICGFAVLQGDVQPAARWLDGTCGSSMIEAKKIVVRHHAQTRHKMGLKTGLSKRKLAICV